MSSQAKVELMQAVMDRLYSAEGLVMGTTHLAKPFMDYPNHYPATDDAGYRRVLNALRELQKQGKVGRYTTVMNENVWWAKNRVDRACSDDIPF